MGWLARNLQLEIQDAKRHLVDAAQLADQLALVDIACDLDGMVGDLGGLLDNGELMRAIADEEQS